MSISTRIMHDTKYITQLAELYNAYPGKDLESVLGVSVRSIQNYLKEENPTTPGKDVIKNIREVYAKHERGEDIIKKAPPPDDNDYRERALFNLTESNRVIAESNASLARSNEELVQMVKQKPTANVPLQNEKDVLAMRSVFLELLSEVGSGKRYKSPDEVKAAYNKGLADALGLNEEGDTRKRSGKQHSVK